MKFKILIIFIFCYISNISFSQTLPESIIQGALIGQLDEGDSLKLNGKDLKISPDKQFVFAVGRDELGPMNITVLKNNEVISINQIKVIEREYEIQRINGLPKKMVSPDEEVL